MVNGSGIARLWPRPRRGTTGEYIGDDNGAAGED
jgi:hypothetical protein